MTAPPTDPTVILVYYQSRVTEWHHTKQIITKFNDGKCGGNDYHEWTGMWKKEQPVAKLYGKRRGIRPIIYAATHGVMPTSVDDPNMMITMMCDQKLCVNPHCMKTTIRDKSLVRSARTKSYRTTATYMGGVSSPHTVTADRIQSANYKRTKLQQEAESQEDTTK